MKKGSQCDFASRLILPLYVAVALCLFMVWGLNQFQDLESQAIVHTDLDTFPMQVDGWMGADEALDPEAVVVLGLDDWLLRCYDDGAGHPIWLYVGYMENWRASRKRQAHHSPRYCYPVQGWRIVEDDVKPIHLANGEQFYANRLLIQKDQMQRLVIYWFQWGDQISAEAAGYDFSTKVAWLLKLPGQLMQQTRTDRVLIRISTPVTDSPEATFARKQAFIQAAFPLLQNQFLSAL